MTMKAKRAELYGAAVQQPSMTQGLWRELKKPAQTIASSGKPGTASAMARPLDILGFGKRSSLSRSSALSSAYNTAIPKFSCT